MILGSITNFNDELDRANAIVPGRTRQKGQSHRWGGAMSKSTTIEETLWIIKVKVWWVGLSLGHLGWWQAKGIYQKCPLPGQMPSQSPASPIL